MHKAYARSGTREQAVLNLTNLPLLVYYRPHRLDKLTDLLFRVDPTEGANPMTNELLSRQSDDAPFCADRRLSGPMAAQLLEEA